MRWQGRGETTQDVLKARDESPEEFKTRINIGRREPQEESGEVINQDSLMARREHYPSVVPLPVLVLAAGVGVQDERLEDEVCGWCTVEAFQGISFRALRGDSAVDRVWRQLDDVLTALWTREDGLKMHIVQC